MASTDNLAWLRSTGRRYIIGAPKSELKKFSSALAAADGWRTVHEGVEVKLARHPETEETVILCRSADRRSKEQAMHDKFSQRIEEGNRTLVFSLEVSKYRSVFRDRSDVFGVFGSLRSLQNFPLSEQQRIAGQCTAPTPLTKMARVKRAIFVESQSLIASGDGNAVFCNELATGLHGTCGKRATGVTMSGRSWCRDAVSGQRSRRLSRAIPTSQKPNTGGRDDHENTER